MLNREKIEEIFRTYLDTGCYKSTSEICGVSETTIRKYIKRGDPKRGIPPFRVWSNQVSQALMEKSATSIAEEKRKDLETVTKLIDLIVQELVIFNEKGEIVGLKKEPTITDLEKIIKLKYYLLGEPDTKVKVEKLELSPQEIRDLALLILDTYGKDSFTEDILPT